MCQETKFCGKLMPNVGLKSQDKEQKSFIKAESPAEHGQKTGIHKGRKLERQD